MSLAQEIQELEDLHRRGTLNDEEFARAKAAVVARYASGGEPTPASLQRQLDNHSREEAVARIDREWAEERERYMVMGNQNVGRYGGGYPVRYLPTRGGSVFGGLIAAAFGLIWTIFAASIGGGLFALFGVLFIVLGLGSAIYGYTKAGEYEQAERAYRRRRAAALGQPPERDGGPADESDRAS